MDLCVFKRRAGHLFPRGDNSKRVKQNSEKFLKPSLKPAGQFQSGTKTSLGNGKSSLFK
jgi:hypothetical protein